MDKQDEKRVREIAREEALKCIREEETHSQQEAVGLSLRGIFESDGIKSVYPKPKIRVKRCQQP